MTDEPVVSSLYHLMSSTASEEDAHNKLDTLVQQLQTQRNQNPVPAVIELPFVAMDANGVHSPDIVLLHDLFIGQEHTISFEAIRQGEVAVSRDVYALGNELNPQPIYLCTGTIDADVETLLSRLCSTQTRRIIENNFYSSNQVSSIMRLI
jgi:hypothetical protein